LDEQAGSVGASFRPNIERHERKPQMALAAIVPSRPVSALAALPSLIICGRDGYADFAPLGHSVRVRREEEKATTPGRSDSATAAHVFSRHREDVRNVPLTWTAASGSLEVPRDTDGPGKFAGCEILGGTARRKGFRFPDQNHTMGLDQVTG
jgi:hypothetical protein